MTEMTFEAYLQQARTEGGGVIPEGRYAIEVVKAESTTASTGSPMIKYTPKIFEGPYQGRELKDHYLVFSTNKPRGIALFFENMAAFGFDEAYFLAQGTPNAAMWAQLAIALVGRRAIAVVVPDEYGGRPTYKISGYQRYTGPAGNATPGMPTAPGPIAPGMVPQPGAQVSGPVAPGNFASPPQPQMPAPQQPQQAPAPPQPPAANYAQPPAAGYVQQPVQPPQNVGSAIPADSPLQMFMPQQPQQATQVPQPAQAQPAAQVPPPPQPPY